MEAVILFSILIVTIALSIPIGITLGLSTHCHADNIGHTYDHACPKIRNRARFVPAARNTVLHTCRRLMCNGGISRRLVAPLKALSATSWEALLW